VSSFSADGCDGFFRGGSPGAVLIPFRTALSVPVTALIVPRTGLGRFGFTASTLATSALLSLPAMTGVSPAFATELLLNSPVRKNSLFVSPRFQRLHARNDPSFG
jgi:hypothetical protein